LSPLDQLVAPKVFEWRRAQFGVADGRVESRHLGCRDPVGRFAAAMLETWIVCLRTHPIGRGQHNVNGDHRRIVMKEFLVLAALVFVLAAGTVTTMTVYAALACHGC
jgi:hypothetical protein